MFLIQTSDASMLLALLPVLGFIGGLVEAFKSTPQGKAYGGFGDSFGKYIGRGSDKIFGIPSPGQEQLDYLNTAFPGTTPWERLGHGGAGAQAGVTVQEGFANRRTQLEVAKLQADAQKEVAKTNAEATVQSASYGLSGKLAGVSTTREFTPESLAIRGQEADAKTSEARSSRRSSKASEFRAETDYKRYNLEAQRLHEVDVPLREVAQTRAQTDIDRLGVDFVKHLNSQETARFRAETERKGLAIKSGMKLTDLLSTLVLTLGIGRVGAVLGSMSKSSSLARQIHKVIGNIDWSKAKKFPLKK